MSFHCRVTRFAYIILGYLLGFLGIGIALFVHLLILCHLKSFGTPYLAPFVPVTANKGKGLFLQPAWKREYRDDFLNTKKDKKQRDISMDWKYPKKTE